MNLSILTEALCNCDQRNYGLDLLLAHNVTRVQGQSAMIGTANPPPPHPSVL